MTTAHVSGIDIYYEEHGDPVSEPMLLIMGFMTNAGAWAGQIPALSERFRVIAFDNRGCGRTTQPEGPYSIPQLADDAAGLLDAIGISTAHIVGASMGGMIAQEFALRHPHRVRTLVLACTTPGGPHGFGLAEISDGMKQLDKIADLSEMMTPELLEQAMAVTFTEEFMKQPNQAFLASTVTAMQFPPVLDGIKGQAAAIVSHDTYDRLPQISAATLVITGSDDTLVDARNSPLLAERIPNAELRLFDGLRHGFNVEQPGPVNAAILEFVARRSAVPA